MSLIKVLGGRCPTCITKSFFFFNLFKIIYEGGLGCDPKLNKFGGA